MMRKLACMLDQALGIRFPLEQGTGLSFQLGREVRQGINRIGLYGGWLRNYKYLSGSMICEEIQDISCVFQGLCGKGAIYVSGFAAASSPPALAQFKITAVISIARSGHLPSQAHLDAYLYIPAEDVDTYPIHQHFEATFAFLDKHRKQGNVLVHCMQGISRSASVVAAYLLAKYKYSLNKVLTLLRRKRQKINPNKGFINRLEEYCKELGIQNNKQQKPIRYASFSQKVIKNTVNSQFKKQEDEKQTNISKSIEKSKQLQRTVDEKIERLREQVMRAGKIKGRNKNEKMKANLGALQSSNSASLQQNSVVVGWKQNKSLQLE